MTDPNHRKTNVASSEYTRDYYQSSCQGYSEFITSQGRNLPRRLAIPLGLADIKPGMSVVDVGCGRGEIVYQCALKGTNVYGLDYAADAVRIAKETLTQILPPSNQQQVMIQQCDARFLPFNRNSIDRVFMLDVVEHLSPEELNQTFNEVRRILKPGGKLIIHTLPNLWYYHYGYPVYRMLQRLRGQRLPANPRDRYPYEHLHINEQTPTALKHSLDASGLITKVWLESTIDYAYEKNPVVRFGMEFLTRIYPFRWFFCNDIFAMAGK